MPETVVPEVKRHAKEAFLDRFRIERHKGRRRSAGRGVMALISRMHMAGMYGRHVEGGAFTNRPAAISAEAQQPQIAKERAHVETVPQPARMAVEAPVAPVTPEASRIRPEIPTEAVRPAEEAYVGRHRRPETLEESDIRNARLAAEAFAVPSEVHRNPEGYASDNVATGDAFTFSGEDAIPPSHRAEDISGSELWGLPPRVPGERYDPAEDIAHMPQYEASERGITAHDNTGHKLPKPQAPQAAAGWFDGANARHR